MTSVCFYFQVHQPYRLRQDYDFFKIGQEHLYEDEASNRAIVEKVAHKCYLPMNEQLLSMIYANEGKFKVSFSISGIALEQFKRYAPQVVESFQTLVDTGCVEILNETYFHSLSFLYSQKEFIEDVQKHTEAMQDTFGVTPQTFRNTELVYNNEVAQEIEKLGFKAILAEGADRVLDWRSPNFVYQPVSTDRIVLLLKNYRLSDDIAFRFHDQSWSGWPLTAEKYADWIHKLADQSTVINLFMDYETFGEHQWAQTGIFDFMQRLPQEILKNPEFNFMTPAEIADHYKPVATLDIPYCTSWADEGRDLSAWLGNDMQNSAMQYAYSLEKSVKLSSDPSHLNTWRKLLTSDHFYYMSTKSSGDGDVHKYFSPYKSPYDAYVVYSNVLNDLKQHVDKNISSSIILPSAGNIPLIKKNLKKK